MSGSRHGADPRALASIQSAPLPPAPPPADATHVPRPAAGVVRLGPMAGSGYRKPPRLVRRGDGQIVQLTPLLDAILEAVDGQCDLALVADAASEYHGQRLHVDDVAYLIDRKLRPLGLVCATDGREPEVTKANPLLGLRGRIPVTSPDRTWSLTRPFVWLFRPPVVAAVTVAFVAFTAWVLVGRGIDLAIGEALRDPGTVLALLGLIVVSGAFHEIGHAAACRYGGAQPGAMGAALYLLWPAFYTDVTDSYRLDRRGRLRVDLGGLYFNAVFTLVAGAAWALTSAEALLVLVPVQVAQMVRQLIPLVRFDGYHILADLVGVPDLFARIRPTLRRALPWHWKDREPSPLRPWAQAVVVVWVLAVVPALAAMFAYLAFHLPAMLAGASETLGQQAELVGRHLEGRQVEAVLLGVVSMALVALFPLATVYLLSRLAHRTGRGVWRATDGHPLLRGALVGVVVIALALASPGLLPSRPPAGTIAAADGEVAAGISDPAEPPLDTVEVRPAVEPRPTARRSEQVARAEPAPPASTTTTSAPSKTRSAEPARSQKATPNITVPEPAWPFSFPPPAPPELGDNQVVVVNAHDGATEFDLSADLQWVDDEVIDHANRAYALASCVDCRTVAAAFQLVLATAPNHVAVPENLAVAVNEDCEACVTEAVATQVVVTLTGLPDRSVRNRLAAMIKAADARHGWYAQRTPTEIAAEFRRIEAEALALLEPWIPDEALAEDSDADDQADELETTTTTTPELDDTDSDAVPAASDPEPADVAVTEGADASVPDNGSGEGESPESSTDTSTDPDPMAASDSSASEPASGPSDPVATEPEEDVAVREEPTDPAA